MQNADATKSGNRENENMLRTKLRKGMRFMPRLYGGARSAALLNARRGQRSEKRYDGRRQPSRRDAGATKTTAAVAA